MIARVLPAQRRLDLIVLGCAVALAVLGVTFIASTARRQESCQRRYISRRRQTSLAPTISTPPHTESPSCHPSLATILHSIRNVTLPHAVLSEMYYYAELRFICWCVSKSKGRNISRRQDQRC